MNKTEQTYIDKSKWPEGAWKHEPDRVSWIDPETGYHCLIKRNGSRFGIWCGYVSIEKNHPLFEKSYHERDVEGLNVHGGITYAKGCSGDAEFGICHLTEEEDEAWWFGFDCGHGHDFYPGESYQELRENNYYDFLRCTPDQVYRDKDYVTKEVEDLAKQLKCLE